VRAGICEEDKLRNSTMKRMRAIGSSENRRCLQILTALF